MEKEINYTPDPEWINLLQNFDTVDFYDENPLLRHRVFSFLNMICNHISTSALDKKNRESPFWEILYAINFKLNYLLHDPETVLVRNYAIDENGDAEDVFELKNKRLQVGSLELSLCNTDEATFVDIAAINQKANITERLNFKVDKDCIPQEDVPMLDVSFEKVVQGDQEDFTESFHGQVKNPFFVRVVDDFEISDEEFLSNGENDPSQEALILFHDLLSNLNVETSDKNTNSNELKDFINDFGVKISKLQNSQEEVFSLVDGKLVDEKGEEKQYYTVALKDTLFAVLIEERSLVKLHFQIIENDDKNELFLKITDDKKTRMLRIMLDKNSGQMLLKFNRFGTSDEVEKNLSFEIKINSGDDFYTQMQAMFGVEEASSSPIAKEDISKKNQERKELPNYPLEEVIESLEMGALDHEYLIYMLSLAKREISENTLEYGDNVNLIATFIDDFINRYKSEGIDVGVFSGFTFKNDKVFVTIHDSSCDLSVSLDIYTNKMPKMTISLVNVNHEERKITSADIPLGETEGIDYEEQSSDLDDFFEEIFTNRALDDKNMNKGELKGYVELCQEEMMQNILGIIGYIQYIGKDDIKHKINEMISTLFKRGAEEIVQVDGKQFTKGQDGSYIPYQGDIKFSDPKKALLLRDADKKYELIFSYVKGDTGENELSLTIVIDDLELIASISFNNDRNMYQIITNINGREVLDLIPKDPNKPINFIPPSYEDIE